MAIVKNLMVRAGADFSPMEKELQKAQKSLGNFSNRIGGISKTIGRAGVGIAKAVGTAAVAAGGALTALMISAGNTADELLTISAQTGVAVETLQGLDYAARFVDVELETLQKGWAKTTKAMGKAVKAGKDYIDIADGIKVSTRDANGKMKSSEQMFYDSIDAIGKLKDETMQEIAAQELFGKSYQELMPLINGGSASLKKYIDEAERLGLVISKDDMEALGDFDDAMERIEAQVKSLGMKVAVVLLPIMKDLADFITNKVVPAIENFVSKYKNNPEFANLSFEGKIKFIWEDISKVIEKWWNGGGKAKVTKFGNKVAIAIGNGFAAAAPTVGKAMASALINAFGAALSNSLLGGVILGAITGGAMGSVIPGFGTIGGAVAGGIAGGGAHIITDVHSIATGGTAPTTTNKRSAVNKVSSTNKPKIISPFYGWSGVGLASGTDYWKGGPVMVGEEGPEIANLPRGTEVLNHRDSMGTLGSQTVNHTGVVIHQFQTNDRQVVAKVAQEIERGNRRIPQRVAMLPSRA